VAPGSAAPSILADVRNMTDYSRPSRCLFALLLVAGVACVDRSSPRPKGPGASGAAQPGVSVTMTEAAVADSRSAVNRLRLEEPVPHWDEQSVLSVDVDCDGRVDSAFVGRSDSAMYVGVVTSAASSTEVLAFGLNGNAVQDAVCSDKAKLTTESLDYDPTDAVGPLPGFERSRVCMGLNLGEEDCDSIHTYWNHVSHHLDWWRA
jgi:hypothetical protein